MIVIMPRQTDPRTVSASVVLWAGYSRPTSPKSVRSTAAIVIVIVLSMAQTSLMHTQCVLVFSRIVKVRVSPFPFCEQHHGFVRCLSYKTTNSDLRIQAVIVFGLRSQFS